MNSETLYRKVGKKYVPVSVSLSDRDYMRLSSGLWLVQTSEHSRSTSFVGKLADLQDVNPSVFIQLKTKQSEIVSAVRQAIEETKRETPDGTAWWTIDLWRITDAIFKVLAKDE